MHCIRCYSGPFSTLYLQIFSPFLYGRWWASPSRLHACHFLPHLHASPVPHPFCFTRGFFLRQLDESSTNLAAVTDGQQIEWRLFSMPRYSSTTFAYRHCARAWSAEQPVPGLEQAPRWPGESATPVYAIRCRWDHLFQLRTIRLFTSHKKSLFYSLRLAASYISY